MNEPCVYDGDPLLASAARFLIDGHEENAANVLLSCSLDVWESGDTWYRGDETLCAVHVELTGPRAAYDIFNNRDHPITKAVRRALAAVLPTHTYIKHFSVAAELMSLDPRWREEFSRSHAERGYTTRQQRPKPPGYGTTSAFALRARCGSLAPSIRLT